MSCQCVGVSIFTALALILTECKHVYPTHKLWIVINVLPTTGYRMRTRSVTRRPDHGGKECEHEAETQPCRYELCYSWRVQENASYCELLHSYMSCGNGTKHYAFGCYTFDGVSSSSQAMN